MDYPKAFGPALQDLKDEGRYRVFADIRRTMHLLNYLDDASYRRRILVQLNRGEARHMLSRAVFHGKRGELRQRYRQGRKINSAPWA